MLGLPALARPRKGAQSLPQLILQCNSRSLRRTDKPRTKGNVPFSPVPPLVTGGTRSYPLDPATSAIDAECRGEAYMVESLIAWLIVGAIAGWLAGLIVKGYGFGLIGNIVVGIVGAVVAGYLLPRLGIALGVGMVAAIINAVIGAVVLLVIIGLVRKVT
jgi:uncharacterized membrane protein YeaQ/YmgE (transglycosylase-associated protein family)